MGHKDHSTWPRPHVTEFYLPLLRVWAQGASARFAAPLYLVGSALAVQAVGRPRDWDVRCWLSNEAFAGRYMRPDQWLAEGQSGDWSDARWRWARECAVLAAEAEKYLHQTVDFQVVPDLDWRRFDGCPRLRIDTNPALHTLPCV